MKRRITARTAASLVLLLASASVAAAQSPSGGAAVAVPQGAFMGVFRSTLDSVRIHLVDVRLYFIDSTREVSGPFGLKTIDTFVDTARSRIAATDSTGFFVFWRLAAGRYLMNARRIGFSPIEALITIDSTTVLYDFVMSPIAAFLNKVEIREVSPGSLEHRLDVVGFAHRKKFNGDGGTFMGPAEVDRYKLQTVRDILSRAGVFSGDADIIMDRMPLDYADVQDYPALLVAGVEVYRRNRPTEFNGTRAGPNLFSAGGGSFARRPLVVIWTFIR